MLPCKKSINSAHAASYLKMAESQARSIKSTNGSKVRVIDSCLVEGRKSGNLLSARVTDPEHIIYSKNHQNLGPSETSILRFNDRRAFSPFTKGLPIPLSLKSIETAFYNSYSFGQSPGDMEKSSHIIYNTAGKLGYYGIDLIEDRSGESYVRIAMRYSDPALNKLIRIHSGAIRELTGDHTVDFNMAKKTFSGVITEYDEDTVVAVFNIVKNYESTPPSSTDSMLMAFLSKEEGGSRLSLTTYFFSTQSLPSNFHPKTVYLSSGRVRRAISRFKPLDIEVTEDKRVLVAFKYEFEFAMNVDYLPVECHGLASWGGHAPYVQIHSTEVDDYVGGPDANANFEINPEYAMYGDAVTLIDGHVYRPVKLLERGSSTGFAGVPPYFLELKDGVPTSYLAGSGACPLFYGLTQFPLGRNETYLMPSLNGIKPKVSDTTFALPRGECPDQTTVYNDRPKSVGVLFTDGERYKFESITGMPEDYHHVFAYISCPQVEIRKKSGELASPCVVVVTCLIQYESFIAVRKGPIWPEDNPPEDYMSLWTFTANPLRTNSANFYMGNSLNRRPTDQIFALK